MTQAVPLCVDLDGSLIHSDLLLESFLLLIKQNPLYVFIAPVWLLRGKAHLKAQIARRVALNGAALPYTQPFVDWLRAQKAAGRPLWLCTAADARLAQAVADHLGIFDGVLASNGQLVERASEIITRMGGRVLSPAEGREKMNLKRR